MQPCETVRNRHFPMNIIPVTQLRWSPECAFHLWLQRMWSEIINAGNEMTPDVCVRSHMSSPEIRCTWKQLFSSEWKTADLVLLVLFVRETAEKSCWYLCKHFVALCSFWLRLCRKFVMYNTMINISKICC